MADVLISPNSTEAKLTAFLRAVAAREVRYGVHDCGLWLADWVAFLRGIDDPAAHLRGRYSDAAGAKAVLGGTPYPVVVGRLARRAGLKATRHPQTGAVGVLVAGEEVVGGIKTARGWALLGARGFIRVPDGLRVLGAWELASDG